MDASLNNLVKKTDGQSIVEFLLMMPLLLGLTSMLIRVNAAIQVSIVNQQYSRAQALFIAYNSPYYPQLRTQLTLASTQSNLMFLGVSSNIAAPGYKPLATTQSITDPSAPQGSNATGTEPAERSVVRIRNTVTLCTQNLLVPVQGKLMPILPIDSSKLVATSVNNLNEQNAILSLQNVCAKGSLIYE